MESRRFDQFTQTVGTAMSRRVFGLGLGILAVRSALPLIAPLDDIAAGGKKGKGKGKGKKKHKHNTTSTVPPTVPLAVSPPPPPVVTKGLSEICTPGRDTCSAGLQCSTPTTRHNCNSTVDGITTWCCVPPDGACTPGLCTCCGDYCCSGDGRCIENPENG
jgi:hypothetical protein